MGTDCLRMGKKQLVSKESVVLLCIRGEFGGDMIANGNFLQ